jgi:hypothetical protein
MGFAISYLLLEGNCPGKGFNHPFYACNLMYHKKYIPQSEEFSDIKIIISRCALGSCHVAYPSSRLKVKSKPLVQYATHEVHLQAP